MLFEQLAVMSKQRYLMISPTNLVLVVRFVPMPGDHTQTTAGGLFDS